MNHYRQKKIVTLKGISEVPGNIAFLFFNRKRVLITELVFLVTIFQNLLREIVIDERGLKGQVSWRVQTIAFFLRRFGGGLADCQKIWKKNILKS